MTDRERDLLTRCIRDLQSADEIMEEWEPELRQADSSCIRSNLFIRYLLNSQIAALESLINVSHDNP